MEELQLPTTDHFEPSVGDLIKAVRFIQKYKDYNDQHAAHHRHAGGQNYCNDYDDDYDGEEKKETDPLLQQYNDNINISDNENDPLAATAATQGGRVYIHCRAGHGRSAAVVYVWLLSQENDVENIDMKALNEKLSSLRNVRKTLWKQPNLNKFRKWLQIGR